MAMQQERGGAPGTPGAKSMNSPGGFSFSDSSTVDSEPAAKLSPQPERLPEDRDFPCAFASPEKGKGPGTCRLHETLFGFLREQIATCIQSLNTLRHEVALLKMNYDNTEVRLGAALDEQAKELKQIIGLERTYCDTAHNSLHSKIAALEKEFSGKNAQLQEHVDSQLHLQRKSFDEEGKASFSALKSMVGRYTDNVVILQNAAHQDQSMRNDQHHAMTQRIAELEHQITIRTSNVMEQLSLGMQNITRSEELSREGLHDRILASVERHIAEGNAHHPKALEEPFQHRPVRGTASTGCAERSASKEAAHEARPQPEPCQLQDRMDHIESILDQSFSKQARELEAVHGILSGLVPEPTTSRGSTSRSPGHLAAAKADANVNAGHATTAAADPKDGAWPAEAAAHAPVVARDVKRCNARQDLLEARVDHVEIMLGSLADMVAEQVDCVKEIHADSKTCVTP
mmetsp:Transcript_57716/g.162766  ORF Transcript_57716/g.162766 Transcript_57716/m.162766 type:complete len:459 (+) Transcript_57716:134-1510(+)